MEALAYDNSPLSEYLESSGVGVKPEEKVSHEPACFAPQGFSHIRQRLRDARRRAVLIAESDNNGFLEHFRYLIVTSQLLEPQTKTRPLQNAPSTSASSSGTVIGALFTAVLSFAAVWVLSALRHRSYQHLHWSTYVVTIVACASAVTTLVIFGRRKYHERVQKKITNTLSAFLHESHSFDATSCLALRHIQEVEVISRGYDFSSPLPPITRIENVSAFFKCEHLRQSTAHSLKSLISECIDAHNTVHPYTTEHDLAQYHGIYEVSLPEFLQAISWLNDSPMNSQLSLRDLRVIFETLSMARRVVLCDLLALSISGFWANSKHSLQVAEILEALTSATADAIASIKAALGHEDSKPWLLSQSSGSTDGLNGQGHSEQTSVQPPTPEKEQCHTQIRRMESLANGIRALNARMYVFRETADANAKQNTDLSALSSVLASQHEQIGAELRSLLEEWELGRRSMHLGGGALDRISLASSGLRTPASPSPSLGGITMVEDGPSEALRALNGEDFLAHRKPIDLIMGSDEEVFEAMSAPAPRKRNSLAAMSREERIAKLQEDRRKRATLQEHTERTTNMLRELEMVIKHRPRGRTTSRIPTSTNGAATPSI